jgi:protein-S-isoprenylcysteine O-methyltransferase Ste14
MKYIVYTSGAALLVVGIYHRLQAARTREPIDRRQEGWPILLGIRLSGLVVLSSIYLALREWQPAVPTAVQWAGTFGFAVSAAWLIWMFFSLGTNLTDTVITRRASIFVSHGPYRYVRNPMYLGVLAAGASAAMVLNTWIVALFTLVCFIQLAIRTRIEERFLIARFGYTYKRYMEHVGRFWPNLL